ncbi:hypothetical protein MNBD_GAMMA18-2159 [hydrothermal vent metagenome]|uniref:Uncharacterized protein n=1 Tax=hydrothermal vent metagenome TaxID=652676 RepID=A0A3B0ZUB9_9ZZZZ
MHQPKNICFLLPSVGFSPVLISVVAGVVHRKNPIALSVLIDNNERNYAKLSLASPVSDNYDREKLIKLWYSPRFDIDNFYTLRES